MVPRSSESSGGWEALARKDGDMLSCQHETISIDDRGFHAAFSIRLRPGILRGNGAGAVSKTRKRGRQVPRQILWDVLATPFWTQGRQASTTIMLPTLWRCSARRWLQPAPALL
jgi:hypothetical protein